ncbi:MAG: hypothetical protein WBK96_13685 [Candidatus Manganitrophaceae bacterium]
MVFTFLAICIGLSGCMATSALLAMTRSTDQFLAYTADPRVMYEPGAEEQARDVAEALPTAIETVERAQYRDFVAPVRIYVCANLESFKTYGAPSGKEGGFVLNKRLFLSPKPENTAERIPRLLTHELSHLHLGQQLGLFKSARIPSWFQEGLAVYVANGGGAETVTEDQAREAIQQGRYFHPETEGSLLFPKRAHDYGLEAHLFYREASMFVADLKRMDVAKFKTFLLALEDGVRFATAFQTAYGVSIEETWRGFLAEMQKPNPANMDRQ